MVNGKRSVAVVTGSTSGLGKSVALRLAADGIQLIVTGRNEEAGAKLARQIADGGGSVKFVAADIEDVSQAKTLVDEAVRHFGSIDILVASAGAKSAAQGIFGEVDTKTIADQVARTILIKLNPVHAAVPYMIEQRRGAVLFITSEGGRFPTPGQTTVSFHSGGLIMAARVMAKELSRHRIRVNTLAVTLVENTPIWQRFSDGETPQIRSSVYGKIAANAPFGLAQPEDIANVAAFLVSEEAGFITGATVSATGGMTFS